MKIVAQTFVNTLKLTVGNTDFNNGRFTFHEKEIESAGLQSDVSKHGWSDIYKSQKCL